jgi:hypothetical protein
MPGANDWAGWGAGDGGDSSLIELGWGRRNPGRTSGVRKFAAGAALYDGAVYESARVTISGIRWHGATSLVRGGVPFYNPSNTASEAVLTLISTPRAVNRNLLNRYQPASELNIDSHFRFSQEH